MEIGIEIKEVTNSDIKSEIQELDRDIEITTNKIALDNSNLINALKYTKLGEQIKTESNKPKKIKKDKFYSFKLFIKRFFKLFG